MSSLSKITIEDIVGEKIKLKIERIHPDAPSLTYLKEQNEQVIKTNLLFRLLILIEGLQKEDGDISKLYEAVFSFMAPHIEEEHGDSLELNKYTDLTEYGSTEFVGIVDNIIVSVTLLEQDINDNWEKGLIQNFNPYQTAGQGIPFMTFEIELKDALLEDRFIGKVDYSALSVSCEYK